MSTILCACLQTGRVAFLTARIGVSRVVDCASQAHRHRSLPVRRSSGACLRTYGLFGYRMAGLAAVYHRAFPQRASRIPIIEPKLSAALTLRSAARDRLGVRNHDPPFNA